MCFISSQTQPAFTSKPVYTVLNKWYDSSGQIVRLDKYRFNEENTLHTKIDTSKHRDEKLIIKSKDTVFNVSASGKILYDKNNNTKSGLSRHYSIISIDDTDGEYEIYLHMTPCTDKAEVEYIHMQTNNDFLFQFIYENKAVVILTVLLSALSITHIIITIILILTKEKAARHISTCCFINLLTLFVMYKCCLLQFIIGSNALCHFIGEGALLLMPTALLAVITIKHNHPTACIMQCILMFYATVRIILFLIMGIPMSTLSEICYCIIGAEIISYLICNTQTMLRKGCCS